MDSHLLKSCKVVTLSQSDLLKCPHCILMPQHYFPDGTCRCKDREHKEMEEWGYEWSESERYWAAPPEEEEK